MNNEFDTVRAMVRAARDTQKAVDEQASVMAGLIVGRLKAADVSAYTLKQLKRELRDFDMVTGTWRKR